ncbi:glycosyl hydrolase family 8 [Pontibaca salina]|uniref:cellulase n=1 Tax=Pontibaca salina TaxID=2795731 RepID=A0A934HV41_9RHOB|nr:glycosyl hydrolase family 8 [Pontibaca salina]MBI6630818.1 glycosyl hydrolase family 5 [Pontibaca salina]
MHSAPFHRRDLLLAFAGLAAGPGWALTTSEQAWDSWKAAFVEDDGRVIDDEQDGISHSEGQAYGLLLAQAFGDRDTFERIETWIRATLATRQDALMAWKWQNGAVRDWRNATDGDLLRAWALLRATRDSGWSGHFRQVQRISRDLVRICLAPDPRASDEPLLKPADQAMATTASVIVNPSYYVFRALIELGQATNQPALIRTAAHGERLLTDPGALRDWIEVQPDGLVPAHGFEDCFGWDALRIPLYLAWSERTDHPALARVRDRFAATSSPKHVATVTGPDGQMRQHSDAPGFRAVAALAALRAPGPAGPPGQGYYPATLGLLAQIAWREGVKTPRSH